MNKKVILLILDGWGLTEPDKYNAVDNAKTPVIDKLIHEYPNTRLKSDGLSVGLPEGQFGTSEINHQVIGTGQVVLQDLPRIDTAIEDESFFSNDELVKACNHIKDSGGALHLTGIISDGKVHCSLDHLLALIELASKQNVKNLYIHAFLDGRDAAPKSAKKYLKIVQDKINEYKFENASIATIQGRFFLDRDRDWSKTETALSLMVDGEGVNYSSYETLINFTYNQSITDEFFPQSVIDKDGLIKAGDSVVFFHYRSDRMFQIQRRLIDRKIKDLNIVSFISVFQEEETGIAFPRKKIEVNLSGTISKSEKKQIHITETEKYTHLTFFFNAGRDVEYPLEEWLLHPSDRFVKPFYNFSPSMQSDKITESIIESVDKEYDFILVNFSNPDMVGHTGNYEAAVVAIENVDYCVGKVYEKIKDKLDEYALIILSDHGNSDVMWDYENNQPHTQHTTSPVPFILVTDLGVKLHRRDTLADVAPTILDLMGVSVPKEMEGESLIIKDK
ncbi:MAG: 2,3-bisphosphoglycerate-independent phosphoglycerate mutase [Candidatus Dojkabacteria bacterium]|nr:2,3-bisphosphoglycerate-independent phosphoglycerate mutase [Candidatus Dojkabacteria bacterium]